MYVGSAGSHGQVRVGRAVVVMVACVLALAGRVQVARGQRCTADELQKLLASDGAARDQFGGAVAMSGDTAIIGALFDDDNGRDSGSAFIFRIDGNNWNEEAKLLASDGGVEDELGTSVSIDGDVAIVGAAGDDHNGPNSGSAYVFRFDGTDWNQEAKLLASDGAANEKFGDSVSISGDIAIVGAPLDNGNRGRTGSAFIFQFDGSNWSQVTKLLALDRAAGDFFGKSVSLDGDVAVVGALFDDNENGDGAGSAYIFRFDGSNWNEEAKLLALDGAENDMLGGAVSINGDVAIVGAQGDDDHDQQDSGSAFVFRFDGDNWNQEAKLLASDGESGDNLGVSVSLDGDVAIVGERGDNNENGSRAGSAFIFQFDGSDWNQQAKLLASDGALGDRLGDSVSLSGDKAIVGAQFDDNQNGTNAGGAYLFAGVGDCNDNRAADICDIQDGTSKDQNGNGIPDECEGCVRNPAWQCDGDTDGDGQVNPVDSGLVQASFGSTDEADLCQYDVDCDGQINPVDSGIVQSLFGTCNAPRAACP